MQRSEHAWTRSGNTFFPTQGEIHRWIGPAAWNGPSQTLHRRGTDDREPGSGAYPLLRAHAHLAGATHR